MSVMVYVPELSNWYWGSYELLSVPPRNVMPGTLSQPVGTNPVDHV